MKLGGSDCIPLLGFGQEAFALRSVCLASSSEALASLPGKLELFWGPLAAAVDSAPRTGGHTKSMLSLGSHLPPGPGAVPTDSWGLNFFLAVWLKT